ncbi:hypothetical protein [Mycolicibacterium sarraceniae]
MIPGFRSLDSMKEFYERSIELLKGARIVIEPLSADPVEVMPS